MSGKLFTILILSETLMVALVALVFLYYRLRKARQQRLSPASGNETLTDNSHWLEAFDRYIHAQQEQLEALNRDPAKELDISRRVFNTRVKLLSLEREIAQQDEADKNPAYWQSVHKKLLELQPGYQQVTKEDTHGNSVLLKQQEKTIQHLKGFINQLLADFSEDAVPNQELDAKFDEVQRTNRELEQCVMILEDENVFLRAQIAELLKASQ